MKIINTLIVENELLHIRMLQKAVESYNESKLGNSFKLEIVGIAKNYAEATGYLNAPGLVRLVLLDIHLDGRKSGYDIFKEYGDVSYIIVSQDKEVWFKILHELNNKRVNACVQKLKDESLDTPNIIEGIKKFVAEEKNNFFAEILRYGKTVIYANRLSLISKSFLKVQERPKKILNGEVIREFLLVEEKEPSNANFYFCENRIEPLVSSTKGEFYAPHFQRIGTGDLSIKDMVQSLSLDPNRFIQISQSHIVNLNGVESIDKSTLCLNLKLRRNREFHTGAYEVLYAKMPYSKKYLTTDKEKYVEDYIAGIQP